MSSDLIFYILPRLGKAPIVHHSDTVQKVHNQQSKQQLSDEEKELQADERDAREKHEGKDAQNNHKQANDHDRANTLPDAGQADSDSVTSNNNINTQADHNYTDAQGQRHIDDYA